KLEILTRRVPDQPGSDAPPSIYFFPPPVIPSSEFGVDIGSDQRSPIRATRAGTVSTVKAWRSRSSVSSSHERGVETVGLGLARTAYTPATVFPRMFCR